MRCVDAECLARGTRTKVRWAAKSSTKLLLIVCLILSCGKRTANRAAAEVRCENDWVAVANGIEYRTANCADGRADFHLVRVDPKLASIDAVMRQGSTAEDLPKSRAFAVNANFFDEQFKPLGVVASGGRLVQGVHPVSWQSVFCVMRDGRLRIVPTSEWKTIAGDVVAAAQAGPRLIVDGAKNDVARATPDSRSGVCIDAKNRAIFFVTGELAQLDVWQTIDFATQLGCRDAMLFDGGPSAQLYVRRQGAPVDVPGDKAVPVFIVGSARSK